MSLLWPHELQHTRLLCPLRVCSDSCPLNQWCCLTIAPSTALFSFCLQFFLASGSFPMSLTLTILKYRARWWVAIIFVTQLLGNLLYFAIQLYYTLLSFLSDQCKEIEENNRMGKTAAAAKSLKLCLTLCDPIDGSPPGSADPGILQARTLEWITISFSNGWKWKVKVKSLSRVQLFRTPWTAAYQAPPSMGFSRQEYWSGLPLPSPWERLEIS